MRFDEFPHPIEPDAPVAGEATGAGLDGDDLPAPDAPVADPVDLEAAVTRSAFDRGAPHWIATRSDTLMPTFLEPVPARRYAPGKHRAIA
ncbi:MAG TPA: hypothetical protein VF054_00205 [Micromonosporaceae bacterium]